MRLPWIAVLAACSGNERPAPPPPPAPVPVPAPVAVTPPPAPPPPAAPVMRPILPRHVVILSEDGMRPDVFTDALTPRHMALMKEGTVAHAETIPESDTLPSHASMLSGFPASAHGLWWNSLKVDRGFIHVPTVFSAAHAAGITTAMFVGKPKLHHIALPGTVDHFERPSYLCGGVAKAAGDYFASEKPGLMFVHFSDPDEYGHAKGWMSAEYLKSVQSSDKCLATLLEAIDATDAAASTLVIVTADHGGHGFRHSDGHDQVDRDIPWIVRGPGITPGGHLEGTVETVDTAATALAALGLPPLAHMTGAPRLTFTR